MLSSYNAAMRKFLLQIQREDWGGIRAATRRVSMLNSVTSRLHSLKPSSEPAQPQASPPKLHVIPLGRLLPTDTLPPPPPVDASAAPRSGHIRTLSRNAVSSRALPTAPLLGTPGLPPPIVGLATGTGGFGSSVPGLVPPPALVDVLPPPPMVASISNTHPFSAAADKPSTSRAGLRPSGGLFSPYAVPPPRKPRTAQETVGKVSLSRLQCYVWVRAFARSKSCGCVIVT